MTEDQLSNSSFENDRQGSHGNQQPSHGSRTYPTQTANADPRQWPQQSSGVEWSLDSAVYNELFQGIDLNSFFASESFLPSTIGLPNAPVTPLAQSLPYHTTAVPQTPSTWPSPAPLSSSGSSDLSYEPRYLENVAVPQNPWFFDLAQSYMPLQPLSQEFTPSALPESSRHGSLSIENTQRVRRFSPNVLDSPQHSQQFNFQRGVPPSTLQQLARKSAVQKPHAERRARVKRPKRGGPLSSVSREKAENMRDVGACWRCRKYKKSCNGDGICDACQIPNFKVWPTELGCRRERLGSLVLFLLPPGMEAKVQAFPGPILKSRSWRQLMARPSSESPLIKAHVPKAWATSIDGVQSTNLFHDDYAKLISIITAYQRTLPKPNACLETGCSLIIATSVFYNCFVDTNRKFTKAETINAISEVRKHLARCFMQIEKLCLSSKRSDWFPALLGACLLVCSSIIYIDAMIVIEPALAEQIWGSSHERRMGMRQRGYQMLLDYLRASTNGINPLKLESFSFTNWSESVESSSDRAAALQYDPAAISGVQTLQLWYTDHKCLMMEGKEMFQKNAYNLANIWPVAGLFLLFDW